MNKSQNIYDNPAFFEGYQKIRNNPKSANIIEEKPALFSLSPNLAGKKVIDLGCGYGENCSEFLKMGASAVTGVDISEKMLSVAKSENDGIDFVNADFSDLSFTDEKYDIVFSSLAVHYINDFEKLSKDVYNILNAGGYFIFSQEHPFTTAPENGACWMKDDVGEILHYKLTDYSVNGKRTVKWIIDGVVKYHRTFSEIINSLISAGFTIEKVLEPVPSEELICNNPELKKELHKPNFLLIKAKKI